MKKIKILIYKLWNKVYCWCHKKPKVVGTDDTLDKLIKDNCSISRFGDGEFSLILGGSIAFQRYDKVLEKSLGKSLKVSRKDIWLVFQMFLEIWRSFLKNLESGGKIIC